MTKSTVFIIDDDVSARRGLTRLIGALGLDVESFASAKSFLASGRHAEPGCIVLDVKMPKMTGPMLQEELAKTGHHLPIIFVSAYGDVPTTAQTMKMGAIDFLTKPVDRDHLLEALTEALTIDAKNRAFQAEKATFCADLDRLTPREYQVLTYVIAGLMNKQIARELGISEITVKTHRGRVMRKLGTDSLAELVRMCEKAGVSPAVS